MNILITGGLGYVGGRLLQFLAADPANTLYCTTRRNLTDVNSEELPSQVKFLHVKSFDDASFVNTLKIIDSIIHLAASNEIDSQQNPIEAIEINTIETVKLLNASVAAGVKNFIYFSTAHVYKAPLTGHITEKDIPRPVHPYAITHKAAEDFVLAQRQLSPMNAIVVRLSNSFGAPAFSTVNRWTLLVNDLCRQAIEQKALVLKSTGQQKRDFICLTDVCNATHHLLHLDKTACDGIFNLGGNNPMKIIDMARLIQQRHAILFGNPISLDFKPSAASQNEVEEYLNFDISKLTGTGFNLQNPINQEIDNTLSFCKRHFSK